jgi:dephospho-CoA kinase
VSKVPVKLLVAGHGRHGKDTVCEILRDEYGYTFKSSSQAASDIFLYASLKDVLGYTTEEECYADRSNFRALWFELIKAYNHRDLAALGKRIFEGHDIYCGIRNKEEFLALSESGSFDVSIWVDSSERHPIEDTSSCTVTADDMDIVLDNNGTLEDLKEEVRRMYEHIQGMEC